MNKHFLACILISSILFAETSFGDEFSAIYWLEKADTYYNEGSFDIALLSINKSLELDPLNIAAWRIKGDSFYSMNMSIDAINCYSKIIDLNPSDNMAYNAKAESLL